ncbi:MAG: hypothetical protein COU31_03875, partial [Candidatus Magasanikbacteria bacterium CG10_big_fil_rev_8_21_14_0_10_40_10]
MIKRTKKYFKPTVYLIGAILWFTAVYSIFPVVAAFTPGSTLDPGCAPGAVGCTVSAPLGTELTANTNIIMPTSTLSFNTSTLVINPSLGAVGVGTDSPSTSLHVVSTTEQFRLGYDANNYTSFTVASDGQLTITPSGSTTTINYLAIGNYLALPVGSVGASELQATAVTANAYGGADQTVILTVDADGRITTASTSSIAISADQITSGSLALSIGGTGTSTFQNGGLIFPTDSNLTQNKSELFWDNIGNFLGIGTDTPNSKLQISTTDGNHLKLTNDVNEAIIEVAGGGVLVIRQMNSMEVQDADFTVSSGGLAGPPFKVDYANGFVGIGNNSPGAGLHIGTASTNHTLNTTDDALISGGLEVNGASYFDNDLSLASNDNKLLIGQDGATFLQFSTTQAPASLLLSLSSNSKNLIITQTDVANQNRDFGHADSNDPTIFLHSATDPETSGDNTQYLALYHNQTDSFVKSGKGALTLLASQDSTINFASSSAYTQWAIGADGQLSIASGQPTTTFSNNVVIDNLYSGILNLPQDGGQVDLADITVSPSAASSSIQGYNFLVDGLTAMTIYGSSNGAGTVNSIGVSIGTINTSSYKLYVKASDNTSAGIGVDGYIRATGYITGTSTLDLAETYPINSDCEIDESCPMAGDVVCSAQTDAGLIITKCEKNNADNALGVVSTDPGFILGEYDFRKGLTPSIYRVVALAGRVPVKVSNQNGLIKSGDYLTASTDPGVAVKSVKPGRVIGVALENQIEEKDNIIVFINPSWAPGQLLSVSDNMPTEFGFLDYFTLAIKDSLRKLGLILKEGVAKVKELHTEKLCVGNACINEAQLQQLLDNQNIQGSNSNQNNNQSNEDQSSGGSGSDDQSDSDVGAGDDNSEEQGDGDTGDGDTGDGDTGDGDTGDGDTGDGDTGDGDTGDGDTGDGDTGDTG